MVLRISGTVGIDPAPQGAFFVPLGGARGNRTPSLGSQDQ